MLAESSVRSHQFAELIKMLEVRQSIHGKWLGDILAQYLHSLDGVGSLHRFSSPHSIDDNITVLLDLEANPSKPHHISGAQPLIILAQWMCRSSLSDDDENRLIHAVFAHPTVVKSLEGPSLLEVVQELEQGDKFHAIKAISALYPDMESQYNIEKAERSVKAQILNTYDTNPNTTHNTKNVDLAVPMTAIEKALQRGSLEEVEALSHQINAPTFSGTSLLFKAVETMSDAWVCHLLRLGANPNDGPFALEPRLNTSDFAAKIFPVEAAVRLRRTRACLELLRHGAHIDWLGDSLIRIAQETGNYILTARLYETFTRQKETSHQESYYHGRTALVTACRMLSYNDSDGPPGFPQPVHAPDVSWDWVQELDKIIYWLILNENSNYVNVQDTDGRTALHHLTGAKKTDNRRLSIFVNLLLSRGAADPNARDAHGKTPLELAIWNSMPVDEFIQPLLEAGANPSLVPSWGWTSALGEAIMVYQRTKEDVVRLARLLLRAGADPRDPQDPTSPDPHLIASATVSGVDCLIGDFEQYTGKLNRRSTDSTSH